MLCRLRTCRANTRDAFNSSRRKARLWESRQARLAWAASVLALAVGHLLLPGAERRPAPEVAAAPGAAVSAEELAGIADLPRISLEGRPMAAAVRTRDESELDLDGPADAARSEENAS